MATPQLRPQKRGGLDLETELVGAVRGMNRTEKIGSKQGWRRKEVLKGDLRLSRTAQALIDDGIDAGAALEDLTPFAHRLESYIIARVAERDGVQLSLVDAYAAEQGQQGVADGAQYAAVVRTDETALRTALDHLYLHRQALNAAIFATVCQLNRVLG